ncbi:MAG: hypothetical protein RHS_2472 [Robinsoniella sp. RHS]|nr:MAG: hypothetical protein RHS_2472 [Robinsoniella sp. RHS]
MMKNCLATTGLSLVLLAFVATLYHARFLFIVSVYQTLVANIFIHLGLALLQHFESKFFIVEIAVEIGYVLAVLILSGYFFGWYSSTPLWVLILLGIAVYLIGCFIGIFRMQTDVEYINQQLELRKEITE